MCLSCVNSMWVHVDDLDGVTLKLGTCVVKGPYNAT